MNVYPESFKKHCTMPAVCGRNRRGCMCFRDMNQYHEDTGLQMDVSTGYGLFG